MMGTSSTNIPIEVSRPDASTISIAVGKLSEHVDVSKLMVKEVVDGIFAELAQAKVSLKVAQERLQRRVSAQEIRANAPQAHQAMADLLEQMSSQLGQVNHAVAKVDELKEAMRSLNRLKRREGPKNPDQLFQQIKLLFNSPVFARVITQHCPDLVSRLQFSKSLVVRYEGLRFTKKVTTSRRKAITVS
jgi:hypothetical protein